MRLIDADALVAKMNLAIAMLKRTMKNFDIEDDPECQMELKAYRDIRDGIKDEPTIEPERKKGKWIDNETSYADGVRQTCTCSVCGQRSVRPLGRFCRWCGADMSEDNE